MVHEEPYNSSQLGDKCKDIECNVHHIAKGCSLIHSIFVVSVSVCEQNTSTRFETANITYNIMPTWMRNCEKL